MRKRIISIFMCLAIFIVTLFTFSMNVFAAGRVEEEITSQINELIEDGELPSWHERYINMEGYQAIWYKMCILSQSREYFANQSESEIWRLITWYTSERDETWSYILEGLDIEPQYLEQDKFLGIYFDSIFNSNKDTSYLYLIWTSHYTPSEFVNLVEFTESGKTYKLYDSKNQEEGNWWDSDHYNFKSYDLTIHLTPIGGVERGDDFGIKLKRVYNFSSFKYEIDDKGWGRDVDKEKLFSGSSSDTVRFDLGIDPTPGNGKNSMQLVTHGYEIIKDIEAQSYFDLNFGGYIHQVLFNTTIKIDKIYRVDVLYTVTNEDKKWYQFFLPDDEHTIKKSLTCERVSGGIFGLSRYQGFEEGSFQSNRSNAINFKYRLMLDYDADAWNIFEGKEFYESDYRKVNDFQILRLNYLVDDKTYDVPIKMDQLDSDTLNILDGDLIMDTDSTLYKTKSFFAELGEDIKNGFEKYKVVFIVVLSLIGAILLFIVTMRIIRLFKFLFKKKQ